MGYEDRYNGDAYWFDKFYLGDARHELTTPGRTFCEMQLYRMSVEVRRTVRVVRLKDVSDAPADYYL